MACSLSLQPFVSSSHANLKIGVAHACGALPRVDNSIMSPVVLRPLEFGAGVDSITDFIIDASVNLGNSGGPLLDSLRSLIGLPRVRGIVDRLVKF
ncbi:hypothetical protein CUMW_201910 [Citrus unshiu]|nr:hypothetical protein CUMW_201910 [Citrus unshiu]